MSTQNPRLVVAGDKIIPKGLRTPEVVRSVSIVLHMANGMDYVYPSDEEVRMGDPEEATVSENEVLEALQREIDTQIAQEARIEAERQQRLAEARSAAGLLEEGTMEP